MFVLITMITLRAASSVSSASVLSSASSISECHVPLGMVMALPTSRALKPRSDAPSIMMPTEV